MRQVTTYLAVRPVRALALVPLYSNIRWQSAVLSALRAQCDLRAVADGLRAVPRSAAFRVSSGSSACACRRS